MIRQANRTPVSLEPVASMFQRVLKAIVISVIWGLLLLAAFSYFVARVQAIPPWKVIGEHLLIALCVVVVTYVVGDWVQGLIEAE